jgi:hypothetical protein
MAKGDWVLVICQHFPFAVVKIDGDYNHIHKPAPEIGVWFRHFRQITRVELHPPILLASGCAHRLWGDD